MLYSELEMMGDFWGELSEWSDDTFGPPDVRGPIGPLKHLVEEANEALMADDPDHFREEICDCLFLVFEAARRSGMTFGQLAKKCLEKLAKNRLRQWPDWRKAKTQDEPTEHLK